MTKKRGIKKIAITNIDEKVYYGEGYQDVSFRVPSIKKAGAILGWRPRTSLDAALKKTIDHYLSGGK